MVYKAKAALCSETRKNTQRKASTMQNFWMLHLVVRKVIARLEKAVTSKSHS